MNFITKWKLRNKCQKGILPKYVCAYYEATFLQKTLKRKPYETIRYVVLDTETTGLDLKKDRLLSIGAISIQNKAIMVEDSFEVVLKEREILKRETVKVHGLTMEDIQQGIATKEAIIKFLEYLKADVIVAHHAFFDISMLNKGISDGIEADFKLVNYTLDTAYLAKRLDILENPYNINNNYDLDTLCQRYNISMQDRHTAWGDAFITAKLFLMLTRRLEQRGMKTLNDLLSQKSLYHN